MLKSSFGRQVEWISVKIGIVFARLRIPPNIWTILALAPAIIGLYALYQKMLFEAVVLFFISGFIDAIDGAVARVTGSESAIGAFLDGVVDRYVEIFLYIGLLTYLSGTATPIIPLEAWIIVLVFGALMPSFITAYADHRGVITEPEKLKRMGGLIERAERLNILYLGMILGIFDVIYLVYAVVGVAVLANLTALQRTAYVLRH
ncbi:MAG TPA: CDP-alcohol phosphatidyltransferase family protein [Candidatus Altiarchaeales archaeon]|nr:CDP-alcohol phosphatidyltransferase family protein [Candidatus Altiarchaeales archaeon]